MVKEKTIEVSQLIKKYVTEEYIRDVGCFMQGCKGKSKYVKFLDFGHNDFPLNRRVYHCRFHKTAEHIRIIFK